MPEKRTETRLSDLQQAILRQAYTDMVTAEVIQRRYFPDGSLEAARSAIRRLCGEPPTYLYLQPEPLDERRVYYRLTQAGAKLLGVSPKCAVPLKKQGKVSRYALSWFIHAEQPGKRALINPHDFPDEFGLNAHRLPRHPFFLDETTGRTKLGIVLIDHNAHARRVVHKTLKPIGRFLRHGWFNDLIRGECFLVVVLTFSFGHKKAVERFVTPAIAQHFRQPLSRLRPDLTDHLPIEIQVRVIPGMDAIVTPLPKRKAEQ